MPSAIEQVLAVSVRQPWAWAIVNGFKDVENRAWKTNYRGLVMIHAGKKKAPQDELEFVLEIIGHTHAYNSDMAKHLRIRYEREVAYGGIVGVAWIKGCRQPPKVPKSMLAKSPWEFGPIVWDLDTKRAEMFPEIIPCKGQLGFFKPEIEEAPSFFKRSFDG